MTKPRKRRLLRILGIGCATVVLMVLGLAGWIALQVRAMNRPVVVDGVHPFKSAAKRDRYLANYDARAARWPVPSKEMYVDTSWGETFVRISGPEDGPALVLLPGANATSLLWEPNVAAWSEDYRVFAVDNVFDFGRSVYVRNMTTPEDFVEWLGRTPRPNGSREGCEPPRSLVRRMDRRASTGSRTRNVSRGSSWSPPRPRWHGSAATSSRRGSCV